MSANRHVRLYRLRPVCQMPSRNTRRMGMDCCTLRGILNGSRSLLLAAARVLIIVLYPLFRQRRAVEVFRLEHPGPGAEELRFQKGP